MVTCTLLHKYTTLVETVFIKFSNCGDKLGNYVRKREINVTGTRTVALHNRLLSFLHKFFEMFARGGTHTMSRPYSIHAKDTGLLMRMSELSHSSGQVS